MVTDDSLAYIPLLLTLAVNTVLLAVFFVLRVKKVHISIFQFLAVLTALLGCFLAIKTKSLFLLSLTVLTQGLLFVLHSLLLFYKTSSVEEQKADSKSRFRKRYPFLKGDSKVSESFTDGIMQAGKDIVEISTDTVSSQSQIPCLFDKINNIVMKNTESDASAILLVDEFEDLVSVKSLAGDFPPPYKLPDDIPKTEQSVNIHFKNADFPFEDNIFGQIVKTGTQELILFPQRDPRIFQNSQEDFLHASSYIFVPMRVRDTVIGVIALSRKKDNRKFNQEELASAQILSDFAGIAVKNVYAFREKSEHAELTREAFIAGNLQNALYLKKIPSLPNLSAGNFLKTAEGVCSDYFDIIPSRNDRISFILADVTGKSMVSLTIMIMIRAIMRVIVNTSQTTGTILGWANRGIALEKAVDHYASAALINYDSTRRQIQFATAGTPPILYFSAKEKEWRKISCESEPLGVEKDTKYVEHTMQLQAGDLVVLYTDGLVESVDENGVQYSVNRLKEIIEAKASLGGKQIADAVNSDLSAFMNRSFSHDDQSLVVLKIQ